MIGKVAFRSVCLALTFFWGAGWCGIVAAQGPVWSSSWTVSGPPTFRFGTTSPSYAAAPDGDIVLATPSPSQADYQIMRFGLDGALRWSINLGGNDSALDGSVNGVVADADGSAIVAFGGPFPGYLAKISSSGTLAWSRRIPETSLLSSATGPVIVAGCDWVDFAPLIVSAVDRDSGKVIWQRLFPNPSTSGNQCELGDIVRDAAGNIYLTLIEKRFQNNTTNTSTRAVRLNADGQIAWNTLVSATGAAWPVGADAGRVYVQSEIAVQAFAAADGGPLWSQPLAYAQGAKAAAFVAQDGTVDPVIEGNGSISRLAGDTGVPRWSVTNDGLSVVSGSVVMAGLTRLDPATGGPLWTAALPATDGLGNTLWNGVLRSIDEDTLVIGAGSISFGSPAPYFQTIDAATGVAGVALSVPHTPQGIGDTYSVGWGFSAPDDAGHVLSVAVAQAVEGPEIRLRQQDASDGSVLWDVAQPALPLPLSAWGYMPSRPTLAWTSTAVIVSCAENYSSGTGGYAGTTWIGAFSRATGAVLWTTHFSDAYQQTTAVTPPLIAADGNIFLSTGTSFSVPQDGEPFPHNYGQVSAYKLSAADGHQIWRRDAPGPYGGYYAYTPVMTQIANDMIVGGEFESQPTPATLVRLAGSDGATVWASSINPGNGVYQVYPTDDGQLVATGDGWRKIAAGDGSTLWHGSWAGDPTCQSQCALNDGPVVPGGDVYQFGHAHYTPWLVRLRGDGSGIADSWQPESAVAGMRSYLGQAAADSEGTVWTRLGRYLLQPNLGISFLAKFDANSGTFSTQQALGNFDGDPFTVTNSPQPMAAPVDNHLLVDSFTVDQPGPATLGDALLDTTIVANGDLSVSVALAAHSAMPGQGVEFHFTVTYTGDAPITGVRLIGRLPWPEDPQDVVCNVQGVTNCSVFAEGGNILVSFDIQPGGTLDVSGSASVLESTSPTPAYGAVVFGPPGLNETETRNNLFGAKLFQSIFIDGFD